MPTRAAVSASESHQDAPSTCQWETEGSESGNDKHALLMTPLRQSQSPSPSSGLRSVSLTSPHTWPQDYQAPLPDTRKRQIEETDDSLIKSEPLTENIRRRQQPDIGALHLGVVDATKANDFTQPYLDPRRTLTSTPTVISDAGNQQFKELKAQNGPQSQQKKSTGVMAFDTSDEICSPQRRTKSRRKFGLQRRLRSACQVIKNPMHKGQQRCFLPKRQLDHLINIESVTQELYAQGHPFDAVEQVAGEVCTEEKVALADGKERIRSYRQIFAILVFIGQSSSIRFFMKDGVSDLDLPLVESVDPEDEDWTYLYHNDSHRVNPLLCTEDCKEIDWETRCWSPEQKRHFCEYQWMMLAPFFYLGDYNHVNHYCLKDQHLLPFIEDSKSPAAEVHRNEETDMVLVDESEGGFSTVFMVWIHPEHHNFYDSKPDHGRGFAIKRLLKADDDAFRREVDMLKKFGGEGTHPHVVSILATYEQFGKYHLIFHRADGDLFRYWKEIEPNPSFDYDTVIWLAKQFAGLAEGLLRFHKHYTTPKRSATEPAQHFNEENECQAHEQGSQLRKRTRFSLERPSRHSFDHSRSSQRRSKALYGRHGDLKPENMLWFPDLNDEKGIIKISDLGQAELHSTQSKTRRESKGVHTLTYRPPESDVEPRIIRQSGDIWSLGCIFLEFITWMLGGIDLLESFRKDRLSKDPYLPMEWESDTFYEREPAHGLNHVGAQLKQAVTENRANSWTDLQHIKKLRSLPRCSAYFRDVLHLIETGMLMIESSENYARQGRRKTCGEVQSSLKDAYQKCLQDRVYTVGCETPY
ncbi:hypothetical protein FZEAL_1825 [Fusarium zealandicum]|uniref:Protein kinase domain-containing protein n=1 Tax=Fusarium zealandicum TaxID=1053134 RepID=A0A8H4USN8_9HYPO|nr:hypothetical protein FZEAL_1825 [Fusarium zealandicum]